MRLYASFYAGLQDLIARRRATHPAGSLDVYLTAPVLHSLNVSLVRDTRCHFYIYSAADVYGRAPELFEVLVTGGVETLQGSGIPLWKSAPPDKLRGELVNEPSVLEELDEAVC